MAILGGYGGGYGLFGDTPFEMWPGGYGMLAGAGGSMGPGATIPGGRDFAPMVSGQTFGTQHDSPNAPHVIIRRMLGLDGPALDRPVSPEFANVPAMPAAQPAAAPQADMPPLAAGIRPDNFGGAFPSQAALPPAAQPTAASSIATPPQPGFMDRLGNFLSGNSNTLMMLGAGIAGGRNWGEGIQQGLQGAVQGRAADTKQANQGVTLKAMFDSLVARGIPPQQAMGIAHAASIDPKIAEKLLPQALGLNPPANMEAFIAERMKAASESGKPFNMPAALSEYFQFVQGKNAAEKGGTVQGERQTNAELDLPTAAATVREQLGLIDRLRSHPGRTNPLFWHSASSGYLPDSAIPGNTDAKDAAGLLAQIKGGAFLTAFQQLKGGGAITEVEGAKATQAIARMERSQSKQEFDRALDDYVGIVKIGLDKAAQLAGRQPPFGFQGTAVPAGNYQWTPNGGLRSK